MQYIDWDEMQEEEPEFDKVIKICDRFQLLDIMGDEDITTSSHTSQGEEEV